MRLQLPGLLPSAAQTPDAPDLLMSAPWMEYVADLAVLFLLLSLDAAGHRVRVVAGLEGCQVVATMNWTALGWGLVLVAVIWLLSSERRRRR